MLLWKQTKTLDGLINDLNIAKSKEEADIVLTGGKTVDLNEYPNLKGIFRCGVTKTGLPYKEAEKRSVKIGFPSNKTIEYIYEETANFTCYLILRMLYKDIGSLDPWMKCKRKMLNSRKVLIIGMGKIGSKVAEKLNKLVHIETFDSVSNNKTELEELIKKADCVSIHIPNTPENKSFFDKKKLSWMKDEAIIVNTARGPIVDENDLYEELKNNRLNAAFDVYWEEPYKGKLKEFYPDHFFMTPHTASTSNEFLEGTAKDFYTFLNMIGDNKND